MAFQAEAVRLLSFAVSFEGLQMSVTFCDLRQRIRAGMCSKSPKPYKTEDGEGATVPARNRYAGKWAGAWSSTPHLNSMLPHVLAKRRHPQPLPAGLPRQARPPGSLPGGAEAEASSQRFRQLESLGPIRDHKHSCGKAPLSLHMQISCTSIQDQTHRFFPHKQERVDLRAYTLRESTELHRIGCKSWLKSRLKG